MKKRPSPYIGITGFMTREEVDAVSSLYPCEIGIPKLMFGYLVSRWTLMGAHTNLRWPGRYPRLEILKDLFSNHPEALNLIHYTTATVDTLWMQLSALAAISGDQLDGFQLNICWPDPDQLRTFHNLTFRRYTIVLQIGRRAFEQIDTSPIVLSRKLEAYRDLVDHVLLDPSGGEGRPLDPDMMQTYLSTLFNTVDIPFGIGIAGGLSHESLDQIATLLKEFKPLSIDAEGKLRNESGNLSLSKARKYLEKARELYRDLE